MEAAAEELIVNLTKETSATPKKKFFGAK